MIYTTHNTGAGLAGAGLAAQGVQIARAFGEGTPLPTFRKLRS